MPTPPSRNLMPPRFGDRAEVKGTATCRNSGRIVSAARVKVAIYTDRGWITYCPACGHTAAFEMAELRTTGAGYNRRWKEHSS